MEISKVDTIAASLSLERVGWIFTENNHDTVMTQQQIRMAARFQEEYSVVHSSGFSISNFITVILRSKIFSQLR
jgi:nuclear protein localization family protein 4